MGGDFLKKIFLSIIVCALLVGILSSCSNTASGDENSVTLRLAHNQSETHPVHKSLVEFAGLVEEKTNGSIKVQLYPNGQLGSEREVIELTQTGAVDVAKVSASALESFNEVYSLFSLPYLFDNKEHYYSVMNSDIAQDIYQTTDKIGFIGLTFYDSGIRNFYTKNTPIMHPDDLKGLKIRVQPSATAIEMIKLMGGAPTPMSFGEVYTAMQSGVIDGSENNETALTDNNHGEVAKQYSYSEHSIVPDILIMSNEKWQELTEEQKQAISEAAKESTAFHKIVWDEAIETAVKDAKEKGVTFSTPDKEPFQKAVQPLHEKFSEMESTGKYYKEIREMVNQEE
ncbi:TRAP transporter substrate-binding protein [Metabacillus sediminilitoris]|uniref:TRAP transporter substrate-binding protein n=1 Tax=Metabacillus sediminilitoris TaxID=2567941 RepID=A0A4S4C432_9BACI|nr:DctP family TRAP transporter solute-binding subunit [Metabacillus sediminilitoris]THF82521.1 TRAP transporter substrate-binding protein [Metabacillus sediminilitoris]